MAYQLLNTKKKKHTKVQDKIEKSLQNSSCGFEHFWMIKTLMKII